MRILFVAFQNSVHTLRWITQVRDTGWDIHLFPSGVGTIPPELDFATYHAPPWRPGIPARVRAVLRPAKRMLLSTASRWRASANGALPADDCGSELQVPPILPTSRERRTFANETRRLAQVIQQVRPDVVHTLEFQHAGYLMLAASRLLPKDWSTPWIASNWGSDIYFFQHDPEHRARIREMLARATHYHCECERDIQLAKQHGFAGELWKVLPCAGGYDLEEAGSLRSPLPPSQRNVILVKGYQNWSGRALTALAALRNVAGGLRDYEIAVYSTTPGGQVEQAAQRLAHEHGLQVTIIPHCSHAEMLAWHGRARISLGISVSDGCSTSFLEALTMGSFPIQSRTACADEWVQHGQSGLIVSPHNPAQIAAALRRALQDDALVDAAAENNWQTVRKRLDAMAVKAQVIEHYRHLLPSNSASPCTPSQARRNNGMAKTLQSQSVGAVSR